MWLFRCFKNLCLPEIMQKANYPKDRFQPKSDYIGKVMGMLIWLLSTLFGFAQNNIPPNQVPKIEKGNKPFFFTL